MANRNNALDWLFNPFRFVAGWQAFGSGAALLVLSAVHGAFFDVRHDGLLRLNMGPTTLVAELVKLFGFTLLMTALLWLAGRLLSPSRFRLLDLVGTQWLARWPFQLTSLLLFHVPGYKALTQKITTMTPADIAASLSGADVMLLTGTGMVVLLLFLWTLVLQYQSFAVSCNLKGAKAIGSFAVVFLVVSVGASMGPRALLAP